jgi:hypothetical protein
MPPAREPRPTDLLTAGDIAEQYGFPRSRAEALFWALGRNGAHLARFEGFRRWFIERSDLDAALVRQEAIRDSVSPVRVPRASTPRTSPDRPPSMREGYYLGSERRHTDADGMPLSPSGQRWERNFLSTEGEVYFIRHETGGPVRLGYSINPDLFVDNMNLQSHDRRYKLLAEMPGGRAAERELQIRFRHVRLHGSWFVAIPELLELIKALDEPAPDDAATRGVPSR